MVNNLLSLKQTHFMLMLASIFLVNACVTVGQNIGTNEEIADANVNLAIEYMRQNRLDHALNNLKKALKADAQFVRANSLIASLYQRLNENELALEHFENAIEHVSSETRVYGQVHNNFGAFLCANGQFIDAEENFLLAAENKLYSTPASAYENAGLCALKQAKMDKAKKYFIKTITINPKMPRALLELAKLEITRKQYGEAQNFLRRFHQVSRVIGQSLWLNWQAELGQGNLSQAKILRLQLESDFPDFQPH